MTEELPAPLGSDEDADWYRFDNGRGAVVQRRRLYSGDEDWILTTGFWYGEVFLPRQIAPDLLLNTPLHKRQGYLAVLLLATIRSL